MSNIGQIYYTMGEEGRGRQRRKTRENIEVISSVAPRAGANPDRRISRIQMQRGSSGRGRSKNAAVQSIVAAMPEKSSRKRSMGSSRWLLWLLVLTVVFAAGVGTGWYIWGRNTGSTISLASIQAPEWVDQKLIRKNIYSRPAVSLRQVNDIVVHYVANPESTAEDNRNYFDRLADQSEDGAISASAHFVIGLEGEIIQCIPINEIAYASNNRNGDSIAIECCHPDETGEFTQATYASLVKLTAWLCDETGISRKRVIRHYDITGKDCPRYFVGSEEAWKQFKKDVQAYQGDWE